MNHHTSILHLSDIHFGGKYRYSEQPEELAKKCVQSIRQAEITDPALIIVTGDIAEQAKQEEYGKAIRFFGKISSEFALPADRFVFLPGNHDVNWDEAKKAVAAGKACKKTDKEILQGVDAAKFFWFSWFIEQFQGEKWDTIGTILERDAHLYDFPELKIAIAAFNSCEHESHSEQFGSVSEIQAQAVMNAWKIEEYRDYLKIIALHHNPSAASEAVVNKARDARPSSIAPKLFQNQYPKMLSDFAGIQGKVFLERIIKQCNVHLLLFGHQHTLAEGCSYPWDSPATGCCYEFPIGSFGLKTEEMPTKDQPNFFQMLRLTIGDTSNVQRNFFIYDPNFKLKNFVSLGGFRLDTNRQGSFTLHFTPAESPGGPDNRDPNVIKIAKEAIKDYLEGNQTLRDKLVSCLEKQNSLEIAEHLVCKGFAEAWFILVKLLDRSKFKISDLKEILYWLATAEACKEILDEFKKGSSDCTGTYTQFLNAHFSVIVEIIIAARYERPVNITSTYINNQEALVGEDLLPVPNTGIVQDNQKNYIRKLLFEKFKLKNTNPAKNDEDLNRHLWVQAKCSRPIYVITNDSSELLNIPNLLEFRFRESGNDPVHTNETIIYSVLEQILDRISKEKP